MGRPRGRFLARRAAKLAFALVDPLFKPVPGPRILIYHQVGTVMGREMEVTTEAFRRQVDWLQSNGAIVRLEEAIERWDEPGSETLFVLTFDDGFEDVHRNAFPLLKERGIPFTLYLTTHPIESGEPLDSRYPDARPLTWNQVNEMVGTGLVTVGAHTHTHPDLRSLPAERIAEELDRSNALIEQRAGVRPKHFTYPWGWWSDVADALVRGRYETATIGSSTRSDVFQRFSVVRTPVQRSDSDFVFKARCHRGLRLESVMRAKLRG